MGCFSISTKKVRQITSTIINCLYRNRDNYIYRSYDECNVDRYFPYFLLRHSI